MADQGRNADILQSIVDDVPYTDPPQSRIEDLLLQVKEVIEEGGGTKIRLADVSGAAVATSFNTATLTWSDPEDIVVSGAVLAKWAGTKVLRKAGSAPESITDGVVVVDSKVKNQYSSSGYEDTGLEYGVMYYYRWFPYTDQNIVTDGSAVSVTPVRTKITTVPTQDGTLTYDGTAQTATWNDYDSSKMTVTGDTGTNAGTYTAQFTPKDGYCWDDDTTMAKAVQWVIDKAAGVVTLSESTISLNADTTYADIVITATGGGALSVESSDTTVATVGTIVGGVFRVTADEAGTATITVSMAASDNYTSATATAAVTVQYATIYGAEWDGTSTTKWARTDAAELFTDPSPAVNNGDGSSPFDTIMPWAGMVREERTGGTMVKIPKFWYKWTRDGAKMKLQIADGAVEGFLVSPAHADRGDGKGERDFVYVGAYHCANGDKSTTGQSPTINQNISTFRQYISTHYEPATWQWDFAMYWTVMMLYLVEFADWNSQAVIGYGCWNSGSSVEKNGFTDAMLYHTGTNAATRTTHGHIRYRYIEGLWSNVHDFVDGIYINSLGAVYCIKNPASFSNSSGGTHVGNTVMSSGYISGWTNPTAAGFKYALFPNAVSGSDSTYVCDTFKPTTYTDGVLTVGGSSTQDGGAFYLYVTNANSSAGSGTGSRIMELP